ncbi:desmoglein-2-like [Stegastes partitus]|uniref:Desmoglein-2-like n=1 Tax=Stegastes partitus TaxID=144197 RepID=A0A3B5A252_9TELE|nr:PREDICTED: desmoglein-2-like [Stegastes partitus]
MAPLLKCVFLILLASLPTLLPVGAEGELQRQKREWIIAPRQLKENHDYSGLAFIARIRSDKENFTRIIYSLSGPGVDQPPVGQFRVDPHTGYVKVLTILDREKIPFYTLIGRANYHDGSRAENDIELKITVLDENDNPPVIVAQQVGQVAECSAAGTTVMQVTATDADQEGTINSQIFYRIREESNPDGIFFINCQTGEVIVQKVSLDRELQSSYKLVVEALDMNGLPGGHVGSGEIEIKILDINDNIPTLEQESYEGSIEENTVNVEVMRIKAIDLDLIHTENWLAAYKIVSGNEGGYFSIKTDAKTNEGIIMINKALDYEELKVLNLGIAVANKAEYNFGSGVIRPIPNKSYPIKINVVNQKEGPRFAPTTKVVAVSEDRTSISIGQVIANYAAIDSDTLKIATNVRYQKNRDIDNWLIIDEKTGDIKLNKFPDRESKFLKNGTYYAEVICITKDVPLKTATGTIAIQVEDFNDDCPRLITKTQTVCLEDSVIYATAVDEDEFPNSAPFDFVVNQKNSQGTWTVEHLNETTAILREQTNLWPGTYKVEVEIRDQQGKLCDEAQIIDITVCTCQKNTKTCQNVRSRSTAKFGAAGILLLLLGLLLLLLLPLLLLFCLCGGPAAVGDFKAIPFETKQHLISYHTEGQGEDKDIPLIHMPAEVDVGTMNARDVNTFGGRGQPGGGPDLGGMAGAGAAGGGATLGYTVNTSTLNVENVNRYSRYRHFSGHEEVDHMGGGMMTGHDLSLSQYRGAVFNGMALSDHFLEDYFSSKSNHAAQQSYEKDALLIYDYEGQESPAGSVGCCSLLENDDDLSFLNDLGPKFKTLASICQGSTLVSESVDARVSIPPVRPVSPFRPSTSTHTHVHTHSETIRDRDHINTVNTSNTSNVASGSSTIIREERTTERAQGSATIPRVHIQDNVVIPSQTLLVQQPAMYYATTPMYVVESKPQVMLVAGGAQQAVAPVAQVGMSHGLVQVGGLQGSQGVVLVDRQVGVGGAAGQGAQGLTKGTLSRSRQVLVVENRSTAGAEHEADLAQGIIQTGQSSTEQGYELRGQGLQVKTQSFSQSSRSSAGSHEDLLLTATPRLHGSQRVVVQHKKVSVTERNVDSSTRA